MNGHVGVAVVPLWVFLSSSYDVPECDEGASSFPPVCDSGRLVLFPCDPCEILEKVGVMAVLYNSGLGIALDYMDYCGSCDVDWLLCMCLWLFWIKAWVRCPTFCHKVRFHHVVIVQMASQLQSVLYPFPMLLVGGYLTPLSIICAWGWQLLSKYFPAEVPGW